MGVYILTSMFAVGFDDQVAERLKQIITKRSNFAFVASEFKKGFEKNDRYFRHFLKMFENEGIYFDNSYVVDGRLSLQEAQNAVARADVIWLSGGDSPAQIEYFKEYRLDSIIKEHSGVIIGMSAGAINLAKTSICTIASGHDGQSVYDGLGCVDISVEPHFNATDVPEEILALSEKYPICGMCDESMVVCENGVAEYYGKVFSIYRRKIVSLVLWAWL